MTINNKKIFLKLLSDNRSKEFLINNVFSGYTSKQLVDKIEKNYIVENLFNKYDKESKIFHHKKYKIWWNRNFILTNNF